MAQQTIRPITLLASIAVMVLLEFLRKALSAQFPLPPFIWLGLARVSAVLLLLIIVLLFEKDLSVIGLQRSTLREGIRKGIWWAVVSGSLSVLVSIPVYLIFSINLIHFISASLPSGTANLLTFFVMGAILSPVAEELFFRGILFTFLRKWGVPAAFFVSTALFACLHTGGTGLPYIQLIGGGLFALSFEYTKNLVVPIVIHMSGNLFIFSVALARALSVG